MHWITTRSCGGDWPTNSGWTPRPISLLCIRPSCDRTRLWRVIANRPRQQRLRRRHPRRPWCRLRRLPWFTNPVIGRDEDLALATQELAGETRMLTITGPGGAGKTRLAVEVARRLVGEFTAEVVFVDATG